MSQTAKKWIKADAIDGSKILLANEENFRGRNAADDADLTIGLLANTDTWNFGVEPRWNTYPTDDTSLVNRQYVQDVVAGLKDLKDACTVASTTPLTGFSGTGYTFVDSIEFDGFTVVEEDRVLIKDQDSPSQNGIYAVSWGESGFINLIRSEDADTDAEVSQGMAVDVVKGTVNGRTRWLLTNPDPIELGVTELTFAQITSPASAPHFAEEQFILDSTDISNNHVYLTNNPEPQSLTLFPLGGPVQRNLDGSGDYSTEEAYMGKIWFQGAFASNLEVGDIIIINYAYFV